MDKLQPLLRRDFPDFAPVKAFEAGIPVYFIRLAVEVLEKQKLTTFESYFLKAVALGVDTSEEIARLLGMDGRDLISPGANLLKLEYIQQGLPTAEKGRPIFLTHRGSQALTENGPPPVPKRKIGQIHFNALTWTVMPLEENTWTVERMSKDGLSLLPKKETERPTLGVFTEKAVANALRGAYTFENCEITALLELKKAAIEYVAPVTIVLLHHRKTGEPRLTVYRNGRQQREEAIELQRLFEDQHFKFPEEAVSLSPHKIDPSLVLSPAVDKVTQELTRAVYAVAELQTQLNEQEEHQTATQSTYEREELDKRVQHLKEELRIKREESKDIRQQLQQHQIDLLLTKDHRPLLERTLREAKEEIIIISPWMNRRACDDTLCRLVGEAIRRGVRIRIGYGMGKERNVDEAARNRNNVQNVTRALKKLIPQHAVALLEMKETNGTHQKILICDRTFAVSGSFNWLSYVGLQDDEYREELGILLRQSDEVNRLAAIALQVLLPSNTFGR